MMDIKIRLDDICKIKILNITATALEVYEQYKPDFDLVKGG